MTIESGPRSTAGSQARTRQTATGTANTATAGTATAGTATAGRATAGVARVGTATAGAATAGTARTGAVRVSAATTTEPRQGDPRRRAGVGGWVAQLLAALSVLAGATSIASMIVGSAWWLSAGSAVAVVLVVGIIGRVTRLPAAVRILAQMLALALVLAVMFSVTSLSGFEVDLVTAVDQIRASQPPVIMSRELGLLVAAAVGALAILADAVVEVAPALVAVPILVVFLIGSTVAREQLPWFSFVLPTLGYVLLLTGRGWDWRGRRSRSSPGQLLPAVGMGAVAIALALGATTAMTGVSTLGRVDRSDRSQGISGPSPFTQLTGDLRLGTPVDLFRVTGNDERRYLRSMALDAWTGEEGWGLGEELRDTGGVWREASDGEPLITIESLGYQGRFLPLPEYTLLTGILREWTFDRDRSTFHRLEPLDPGSYQTTKFPVPDPAQLSLDVSGTEGANLDVGELDPEVVRIAQEVTAGAETPHAKAVALQEWFTNPANGFVYNLSVPTGSSGDRLLDFLELKQGYCEQYASAMAVMLRAVGVPARVVLGFGPGTEQAEGESIVTTRNAHAWVEVLFEEAGWVSFDPTPGGPGGTPGLPGGSDSDAAPNQDVDPENPVRPDDPDVETEDQEPGTTASNDPSSGGGEEEERGNSLGAFALSLLPLGALVLLAVMVVRGPRWVRRARQRHRRSVVAAGGPRAAALAWREIEDMGLDYRKPRDDARSVRQSSTALISSLHLGPAAAERLRGLVEAIEREWYAGESDDSGATSDSTSGSTSGHGQTWANVIDDVAQGYANYTGLSRLQEWFPASLVRRRDR